jgi:hypothetical protein
MLLRPNYQNCNFSRLSLFIFKCHCQPNGSGRDRESVFRTLTKIILPDWPINSVAEKKIWLLGKNNHFLPHFINFKIRDNTCQNPISSEGKRTGHKPLEKFRPLFGLFLGHLAHIRHRIFPAAHFLPCLIEFCGRTFSPKVGNTAIELAAII